MPHKFKGIDQVGGFFLAIDEVVDELVEAKTAPENLP